MAAWLCCTYRQLKYSSPHRTARPDITVTVDWALKNQLSIYHRTAVNSLGSVTHRFHFHLTQFSPPLHLHFSHSLRRACPVTDGRGGQLWNCVWLKTKWQRKKKNEEARKCWRERLDNGELWTRATEQEARGEKESELKKRLFFVFFSRVFCSSLFLSPRSFEAKAGR